MAKGFAYAPWPYAGFWLRLMAAMIDAVILLFAFIIFLTLDVIAGPSLDVVRQIALPIGVVICAAYGIFCECSVYGATPGKYMMGLRVVDDYAARINPQRAFVRNVAKYLSWATLGIGFLMVGFTERKQALHDRLAGTQVIRIRLSEPEEYL